MKRRSFASLFVVVVAISLILSGCFGGGSGGDSTPYAASGRITDVQGNGVSGITVSFSGGTSSSTTTDADGKWQASLSGTVKVEPLGHEFVPAHITVTSSSRTADFILVDDYVTVEEKTVTAEDSDVIIRSDNYADAPEIEIRQGALPQGTRIEYKVLEDIPTFSTEGGLQITSTPVMVEIEDYMSAMSQSGSSTITIRSQNGVGENFVGVALFNGEFWTIHEPVIDGNDWSFELNLGSIEASGVEPLFWGDLWRAGKFLVVTVSGALGFGELIDPLVTWEAPMEVYKFEGTSWSLRPIYEQGDSTRNFLSGDDDVILMVHGIKPGGRYQNFTEMATYLTELNPHVTIYAVEYKLFEGIYNLGKGLAAVIDHGLPQGTKVKIISHSMGGIVSRAALEMYGVGNKVSHLVTLASPHLGVDYRVISNLEMNLQDLRTFDSAADMLLAGVVGGGVNYAIEKFQLAEIATRVWVEARNLMSNSLFMSSLNSWNKPSQCEYFFAVATDPTGYVLTPFTQYIYGLVENDGFITAGSAYGRRTIATDTEKYPRLHHSAVLDSREVFDQIALWLDIDKLPVSPTTGSFRVSIHVESTGEPFKEEVWITLGGEAYTTTEGFIQIDDLPLGQHQLEVFATGYKKYFANVTVEPESVRSKTVYLESDNGNIFPTPAGYNHHDYQKLVAFLEQEDEYGVKNREKIGGGFGAHSWSQGGDKRIQEISLISQGLVGTLDLSGCTALTRISCYGNGLTSLDVSGCSALELLYCQDNNLTSLNVSGCLALEWLVCSGNDLTSLDVNGCSALERLTCSGNDLTSLDVSGCSVLESLWCDRNNLTSVDVSGCSALEI